MVVRGSAKVRRFSCQPPVTHAKVTPAERARHITRERLDIILWHHRRYGTVSSCASDDELSFPRISNATRNASARSLTPVADFKACQTPPQSLQSAGTRTEALLIKTKQRSAADVSRIDRHLQSKHKSSSAISLGQV